MWLAFNESMNLTQTSGIPYRGQMTLASGPDTHAHSPRRRRFHNAASSCYSGHSFAPARPQTAFDMPDPFVDNQSLRSTPAFHPPQANGQNTIGGPSPQGKGVELRLPDDQFARLIEALSPRTRSRYVTPNEQANQLLASSVDASSQPSILGRPLFDAKLNTTTGVRQSTSTQLPRPADGTTLWDSIHASRTADSKHGRDPTDISMHIGCTDFPDCNHDGPREAQATTDSPAKRVKGKKEGLGNKEKGKHPSLASSKLAALLTININVLADERNFTPVSNQSPNCTNTVQQPQPNVPSGEKRKRPALGSGTANEGSPVVAEGPVKRMSTRSRSSIPALLQDGESKENA